MKLSESCFFSFHAFAYAYFYGTSWCSVDVVSTQSYVNCLNSAVLYPFAFARWSNVFRINRKICNHMCYMKNQWSYLLGIKSTETSWISSLLYKKVLLKRFRISVLANLVCVFLLWNTRCSLTLKRPRSWQHEEVKVINSGDWQLHPGLDVFDPNSVVATFSTLQLLPHSPPRLCGFIVHTAQNTFVCHVLFSEPTCGPLCKTIEAACTVSTSLSVGVVWRS